MSVALRLAMLPRAGCENKVGMMARRTTRVTMRGESLHVCGSRESGFVRRTCPGFVGSQVTVCTPHPPAVSHTRAPIPLLRPQRPVRPKGGSVPHSKRPWPMARAVSSVGPLTSGNSAFERTLPTQRQRSPSRRNGRPVFREISFDAAPLTASAMAELLTPFRPCFSGVRHLREPKGHENRCGWWRASDVARAHFFFELQASTCCAHPFLGPH